MQTARVFNAQYRERLFALIDNVPFVRHMGMRITDLAWGRATFEMTAAELRLQPFGVVHGGNIATLIDTAAFWACFGDPGGPLRQRAGAMLALGLIGALFCFLASVSATHLWLLLPLTFVCCTFGGLLRVLGPAAAKTASRTA